MSETQILVSRDPISRSGRRNFHHRSAGRATGFPPTRSGSSHKPDILTDYSWSSHRETSRPWFSKPFIDHARRGSADGARTSDRPRLTEPHFVQLRDFRLAERAATRPVFRCFLVDYSAYTAAQTFIANYRFLQAGGAVSNQEAPRVVGVICDHV